MPDALWRAPAQVNCEWICSAFENARRRSVPLLSLVTPKNSLGFSGEFFFWPEHMCSGRTRDWRVIANSASRAAWPAVRGRAQPKEKVQ